ncbi:ABC transporter substrate-binding protein [Calditrichota bacterium]
MRFPVRLILVVLSAFILGSTLIIGCGGGEKTEDIEGQTKAVPFTHEDVPPGALPDVPAELGGEGFTGEGWITNSDYPPSTDPNEIKGGSMSIGVSGFPATVRPIGKDNNSWINTIIEGITYEAMIGIHSSTLNFVPGLATHWQISEDKRTFRFRLDPNARFADGTRVTTRDVLATWKLRIDPTILFPSSNITFNYYEEPVIESPYILSVTTKELNWRLFMYFGGMSILPAKYIEPLTGTDFLREYQFKMVPGSGPYQLAEEDIVKGRSITVTRRKDYWDKDNPKSGGANFDKIKWVFVDDERLRFEKFKSGEFDMYIVGRASWWVNETDFEEVKRGLIQKRKIWNDEPQGIAGMVFNQRVEPFGDIRMRRAFVHLLNREKLIKELFYNEYDYLDSYYPGGIYANPDNPIYRYDPDLAVKLLRECGWTERNQEGWLVNDKGDMLEFELTFTQGWDRIFTVVQEDFQKVGIKINLKETTPATEFKMAMERKFKIHWQPWSGLLFPNPETSYASWLADSLNTNNLSGFKNDRVDELLKKYNLIFDQEERIELIREIDGILMENYLYALGWYAPFTRVMYWNKFGTPDWYIGRISRWYTSFHALWWEDPEKAKALEEAKKDGSIKLPVGKTNVTYWLDWNEKHGRQFKGDS